MATLTIERLVAGGDGVGRLPDGMAVFVPRTAPGDVVEVEVVERRRRFARARVRQLVTEAPGHAVPACRHYVRDRCGGCQLQHLTLETQRAAKQAFVRDALQRIGGRTNADPVFEASAVAWRYRSTIRLAIRDGRVGFHAFDDSATVFALEDCPIAMEPLEDLWTALSGTRPPPEATGLVLRRDREGGLHVVVEGSEGPWTVPSATPKASSAPVSWWWRPKGGATRVVAGPRTGFPALAFEQANPTVAARIREAAVDALGPVADAIVWDLYGGVGDTARLLAGRGATVWSVDQDRSAVAWAERQGVPSGSARFVAGRVEEVLHRLPEPGAVVVNPPRTGLHRRVADYLERWGARQRNGARLCYVSCDPATLARDVARMPAFVLRDLRAYDLFPQTAHVESLAVLEAP